MSEDRKVRLQRAFAVAGPTYGRVLAACAAALAADDRFTPGQVAQRAREVAEEVVLAMVDGLPPPRSYP